VKPFQNALISLRLPPNDFDKRFKLQTQRVKDVYERTIGLREPHRSIEVAKSITGGVGESDTFKICS
jgi:hypothetical protein